VAAEADQHVGLDLVQPVPGGADRVRQLAGHLEQLRGELAGQGDGRDQPEIVPPHGHQAGLQSPLGPQADDLRVGVDAPQRICQGERGLDMPGRAASGEGYPHRRRFLLAWTCACSFVRRGSPAADVCAGDAPAGRVPPCAASRPSQLRALCTRPGPRAASARRAFGSVLASASSSPIPNSVGISDEPPADTSGSGMPVTGSRPITVPMLTRACSTIQTVTEVAARRANGSRVRSATRRPAYPRTPNSPTTTRVPTSPNSSPMIAKMKSLSGWGRKPHFSRLPPMPTPNRPPVPSAYSPCSTWKPDPVGSASGSR